MIDVDTMLIDELRRCWPDMSEAERARLAEVVLLQIKTIAEEFERVSRDMDVTSIEQLKQSLDGLAAALSVKP